MKDQQVRRIFVEKKKGFDIEAQGLFCDLKENLGIGGLRSVRIVNRYDVSGISEDEYAYARDIVFYEPPVDCAADEKLVTASGDKIFAVEYLPGQYDQRADSASQCIQILTQRERAEVRFARVIILSGEISDEDFARIKDYCINPVESHEAGLEKPLTLDAEAAVPEDIQSVEGFILMTESELDAFGEEMGFAMSPEDLLFCQAYFRTEEKRNPTVTELKMIDTYWSDHCRHTTFMTQITGVSFEEGLGSEALREAYGQYMEARKKVYRDRDKDICLMDIATLAMKELKIQGRLTDLDESDEINACSIRVTAEVNGRPEEWLVMFKNETHNHPTEIEPFGGAATCLGGAIRDPLSGRSFVYQAMRVTGSGDPRARVEDTLPGKLPQRKITTGAATGYSSYGNQIGLATGMVSEVYDEGFIAKRMEIGAVIGAAPAENVVREKPQPGDIILLLGGRTGRDGCGGATGSSKEHTEESLLSCGAEVQKGNPPTERKLQRLFRNPAVSRMIKKCNDFGAGGVAVAIGELADGLEINLDAVPKKYEGLDGTELAISESQERMAVVVDPGNVEKFIRAASEENLEASAAAVVTADRRLRMNWRKQRIVDISRDFLDTNGVKQKVEVRVTAPAEENSFFKAVPKELAACGEDVASAWKANLKRLNVCSQKGLVERFDSTIGAGTVLMPFGGKHQLSPAEVMAAKLPILHGDTETCTLMSYGYNPQLSAWSPFHGAMYAVVEASAKIAAAGGDYSSIRLSLQEYFEKLGRDPIKWGKPFSALLGAFTAQKMLQIPAIGGKDSMSGTFKDLTVPPTVVAFAVNTARAGKVISCEFKKPGHRVIVIPLNRDQNELPDFAQMHRNYACLRDLTAKGSVVAAHTVRTGGVAEAISKMCFGNGIGFSFEQPMELRSLFESSYGSIVAEFDDGCLLEEELKDIAYQILGRTIECPQIEVNGLLLPLDELLESWQEPLEKVFPTKTAENENAIPAQILPWKQRNPGRRSSPSIAKPRVLIPVFPGTNCEYDTARAFEQAGAIPDILVIRNLSSEDIVQSMDELAKRIHKSQIIMLPGGFSGGDEPDGSGKFIAAAFRNPLVKEAVTEHLKLRDGLMLGICNGFQALIKLGLVPYGEIQDITEDHPTLTYNTLGRHVSCMVQTKVASVLSPWLSKANPGDIHTVAVSHGEGRFIASRELLAQLMQNGQIATQYVDPAGNAADDIRYNPNGSFTAIEGITSPDGRVLGKMGHSERIGAHVFKNIPGEKDQKLFESGVHYFA